MEFTHFKALGAMALEALQIAALLTAVAALLAVFVFVLTFAVERWADRKRPGK